MLQIMTAILFGALSAPLDYFYWRRRWDARRWAVRAVLIALLLTIRFWGPKLPGTWQIMLLIFGSAHIVFYALCEICAGEITRSAFSLPVSRADRPVIFWCLVILDLIFGSAILSVSIYLTSLPLGVK